MIYRLAIYHMLGVDPSRTPPPRGPYQQAHQPGELSLWGPSEKSVGDVFQCRLTASHLVWGRVVPDMPDFCHELVAALPRSRGNQAQQSVNQWSETPLVTWVARGPREGCAAIVSS